MWLLRTHSSHNMLVIMVPVHFPHYITVVQLCSVLLHFGSQCNSIVLLIVALFYWLIYIIVVLNQNRMIDTAIRS